MKERRMEVGNEGRNEVRMDKYVGGRKERRQEKWKPKNIQWRKTMGKIRKIVTEKIE